MDFRAASGERRAASGEKMYLRIKFHASHNFLNANFGHTGAGLFRRFYWLVIPGPVKYRTRKKPSQTLPLGQSALRTHGPGSRGAARKCGLARLAEPAQLFTKRPDRRSAPRHFVIKFTALACKVKIHGARKSPDGVIQGGSDEDSCTMAVCHYFCHRTGRHGCCRRDDRYR